MAPRDVDLAEWLDGVGFKPADTEPKQLGHEAARNLVAQLGAVLHWLLPAGRDKSLTFTHLEEVLLRANRALALGGGPLSGDVEQLSHLAKLVLVAGVRAPEDPRVETYKKLQRGEPVPAAPDEHFTQEAVDQAVQLAGQSPQAPERAPTYRASIRTSSTGVRVDVSGEQIAGGGGYVQVATVPDGDGGSGDLGALFATFGELSELETLARALDEAGAHAWPTPA